MRPKHEFFFQEGSVWPVIAAPSIWAAHFLLSYWVAAVWCAKYAAADGSLFWVRVSVVALTVATLAAIGGLALHAVRRYRGHLDIEDEFTDDSDRDRARFLGHATLLLCTLSAVAVVFDAVPAVVFSTCR